MSNLQLKRLLLKIENSVVLGEHADAHTHGHIDSHMNRACL